MKKTTPNTVRDAAPSFRHRCGHRRAGTGLLLAGSIVCWLLGQAPTTLASAYSDAVLADNPLVYYQLNETSGTTAVNSAATGSAYNGTYNNVTLGATGPNGFLDKAAVLDGTTSSITVPALANGLTAITIETWLNCASFTASGNANCLFMTDGWQAGGLHYQFVPPDWSGGMPLGTAAFGAFSGSGAANSPAVPTNEWRHFVITCGGGTATYYVDGVAAAPAAVTILVDLIQAHIGAWNGGERFLHGSVAQFALYNKALPASHVLAHYNAGVAGTAAPYHTITATAPAGTTISPSGNVAVVDGENQTFTITGSMAFNITGLEVDGVPQVPQASFTFSTVTDDHTITVLGAAATTTISGNASPLASGQEVTIWVTNTATLESATTATVAGAYSVTAGDGTYTISAKGPGLLYAPAQEVVVAGGSVTHDIALIDTPLVDIRAAGMLIGPVSTATNTGTLGGNFTPGGNGPSVDIVHGKQALQFTGSGYLQLGVGAPAGIIGNATTPPVYSHIAWVYRPNLDGGSQVFLSWAPYSQGALWQYGNPGERYADHWAAGWDLWWNGQCPAAGAWHSLVTTCDGVTEKLYIDGNSTPALSVPLGGNKNFQNDSNNYPIRLGAMGWWDGADPDRYYTGAIGSVQIWPFAIAAADVADAAAAIAPVEPSNARTIHASADANSSITPSGDVVVADGGSQTFTMAANMEYNINDVLVDSVSQGVTNSWTFTNVTGDHTISVSSILATTHIMGVVSGLPTGETAQVTAKGTTGSTTITTGTDGSYAILAGNGTYAVTARGSGLLSVGPLAVTIADADAILDLTLSNNPLVDFRADALPTGAVSSAANPGTLGGNFVATGTSPSVGTVGGKKAVAFNRTPLELKDSGGTPIAPPAAILGTNGGLTPKYTVSAWLYRDSIAETSPWSAGWLSWSVGDHCAWFQYNGGNDGWAHCVDYWGSGYGTIDYPGGVPAAGSWYHFCVTCDGTTTNLWITDPDGSVHSVSSGGSGYLYPDSSIYIGEIAPSHDGGRPFIGGIASVEVWPLAVTVADLPAIRAFAPPVTASTGPYGDWQAAHFTAAQITAGLADPGADPDGDAMTNQQEFAFGLNPNSGASVNPVTVPLDKTTGKFRYTRGATTGLSYSVWTSTNLVNWDGPAAVTEEVVVPPDANQVETVEVTLTGYSSPPGGRLFVRVQAQ